MRSCGILLHISSLPGDYGIGTMGKRAYEFVDFLKKGGQEFWQILPVGPTGYGDSPYQCYSAYAGNPLLIDLDMLISDGLISRYDHDLSVLGQKHNFADYAQLFSFKNIILHKACDCFFASADEKAMLDYKRFCAENNFWLEDYAMFMALKYRFRQVMWTEWDDDIRLRKQGAMEQYAAELDDEIRCWKFIQYKFFEQYGALKKYANDNGIRIYGDMPIYVSMDSADVWASPELFMLDGDLRPTKVAGCPPDDFAPTGQLWGNPLYDWDEMEKNGYRWWISRAEYSQQLYDLTRIDHFRGFESYYAIPAQDKTAENGEWLKGPGMKLFDAIKEELGEVALVAEDLGFLTDDVRKMLKESGYPGMNVLEFAFYGGEDSSYLPHNYKRNSVTYIGTHDNDTALGWYASLDKKDRKFAKKYMGLSKKEGVCGGLIRTAFSSVSELVIIQMQDYLELGSEARMNIPSTIGGGNWAWRMNSGDMSDDLAKRIKKYAKTYFRTGNAPAILPPDKYYAKEPEDEIENEAGSEEIPEPEPEIEEESVYIMPEPETEEEPEEKSVYIMPEPELETEEEPEEVSEPELETEEEPEEISEPEPEPEEEPEEVSEPEPEAEEEPEEISKPEPEEKSVYIMPETEKETEVISGPEPEIREETEVKPVYLPAAQEETEEESVYSDTGSEAAPEEAGQESEIVPEPEEEIEEVFVTDIYSDPIYRPATEGKKIKRIVLSAPGPRVFDGSIYRPSPDCAAELPEAEDSEEKPLNLTVGSAGSGFVPAASARYSVFDDPIYRPAVIEEEPEEEPASEPEPEVYEEKSVYLPIEEEPEEKTADESETQEDDEVVYRPGMFDEEIEDEPVSEPEPEVYEEKSVYLPIEEEPEEKTSDEGENYEAEEVVYRPGMFDEEIEEEFVFETDPEVYEEKSVYLPIEEEPEEKPSDESETQEDDEVVYRPGMFDEEIEDEPVSEPEPEVYEEKSVYLPIDEEPEEKPADEGEPPENDEVVYRPGMFDEEIEDEPVSEPEPEFYEEKSVYLPVDEENENKPADEGENYEAEEVVYRPGMFDEEIEEEFVFETDPEVYEEKSVYLPIEEEPEEKPSDEGETSEDDEVVYRPGMFDDEIEDETASEAEPEPAPAPISAANPAPASALRALRESLYRTAPAPAPAPAPTTAPAPKFEAEPAAEVKPRPAPAPTPRFETRPKPAPAPAPAPTTAHVPAHAYENDEPKEESDNNYRAEHYAHEEPPAPAKPMFQVSRPNPAPAPAPTTTPAPAPAPTPTNTKPQFKVEQAEEYQAEPFLRSKPRFRF